MTQEPRQDIRQAIRRMYEPCDVEFIDIEIAPMDYASFEKRLKMEPTEVPIEDYLKRIEGDDDAE